MPNPQFSSIREPDQWRADSSQTTLYAACDPNNRLIAAQREKNGETELRRVPDLEARQPASCSLVQHCDDLLFRKPPSIHQSEEG